MDALKTSQSIILKKKKKKCPVGITEQQKRKLFLKKFVLIKFLPRGKTKCCAKFRRTYSLFNILFLPATKSLQHPLKPNFQFHEYQYHKFQCHIL